jgi:methionyl-tRNA formyltransferase
MERSKYIILSEKSWNSNLANQLKLQFLFSEWKTINSKEDFNIDFLLEYSPNKIFIPHWSHIITPEIYENYECIVFHMTDLPFGRGGSPLQNLIIRGVKTTKISAIKVKKGLDTGDVYLKRTLKLDGTANEIFQRSTFIIEEMISDIIKNKIKPVPQVGEIVEFKRRKPEESNIVDLDDLEKVYDYIRMLDCEGYPHAYFETPHLKFEFINANFDTNEEIISANVRIFKK